MQVPLLILCSLLAVLVLCWSCDLICFTVLLASVGGVAAVLYLTDDSKMVPKEGKSVLITGCDTGFGHHLAKYLCSRGVKVFAGCLDITSQGAKELESHDSGRITTVQLDVTSEQQVQDAVSMFKQKGLDLWGVFNNAGICFTTEAEITPIELYLKIAQVNLYGLVRVTKAFLPFIRKSKGRVVNVTSVMGILPEPFAAAYCISKAGAEAFSDILRMEMKKWEVKVSVVEPGQYNGCTMITRTEAYAKNFDYVWEKLSDELKETYGKDFVYYLFEKSKEWQVLDASDPTPVMEAATHALFAERPRYRYLVDGHGGSFYDKHCIGARLRQWFPTSFMDWYMDIFFTRGHILPKILRS